VKGRLAGFLLQQRIGRPHTIPSSISAPSQPITLYTNNPNTSFDCGCKDKISVPRTKLGEKAEISVCFAQEGQNQSVGCLVLKLHAKRTGQKA
jgi:hypothetical protein